MNKLDPLCEKLGLHQLDKIEGLQHLEVKTKTKPRHMALVVLVVLVLMMFLEYGASILCQVLGFVYPAYMSFKAIESQDENDDKQWLTYWVVYSAFTLLDMSFGFLLECIPFFSLIKLSIFIFMFHPATLGATTIYCNFLRPFLLKNEVFIDRKINQATAKGQDMVDQGIKTGEQAAEKLNEYQQ